jgi:molecular chaperone GrpE
LKEQKKKQEETQKKEKPDGDRKKELLETLQRVQADFENYKKRVEKEKEEFTKFASAGIIRQLLPVVDNFEAALKNSSNNAEFAKGIEMIYAQLFSVLENAGLKKIDAEGKMFDPYLHEALMQQEVDGEEGIVIEEFQKGYLFNDTVLRHSKVKISKKKQAKEEK